MTIAVCLKCGGLKHGAFSPCTKCGRSLQNAQELAQSMAFTSHGYSFQELEEIGAEIAKTGEIPIIAERRQRDLLNAMQSSPYLPMIESIFAAENRPNAVRSELGPSIEEIWRLPAIIFSLVTRAGRGIIRYAKNYLAGVKHK